MAENFQKDFASRPGLPPVSVLRDGEEAEKSVTKAGLLPFCREPQGLVFCVMRPRADKPEMGPPLWQICKGTRMMRKTGDGEWRDMREGEAPGAESEPSVAAALREANEELGVIVESIVNLFDLGAYDFTSATTGRPKKVRLFAAEMPDRESGLLPMRKVAATTDGRFWCGAEDFFRLGREDHRPILREASSLLIRYFAAAA